MTEPITSFVMVGAPGAGKSTYAKLLQQEYGSFIVSPDLVREQLYGDANIQGVWSEIEEVLDKQIDDNADESIIIDATHCKASSRKASRDKLRKHGHDVIAVVINAPLDLCLKQNQQRSRNVPDHVIVKMWNQFYKSIMGIGQEFKEVRYINPYWVV